MSIGTASFSHTLLSEWIKVGNFTSIADRVRFLESRMQHHCHQNKRCVYTTNFKLANETKITEIGNDVWVGTEAFIKYGVTIGDGAIIGARAVITKDIPPFAVVVGNPGKIIRYRFTPEQIAELQKIKWWDWTEETVKSRLADFEDIDLFIEKYRC